MYDAIDDPYTYEKSTVLVNKFDLRDQNELDAYEAVWLATWLNCVPKQALTPTTPSPAHG